MRWLCILLCILIHNFGCKYTCIYSYSAFYEHKFSNMGIQAKFVSFYFYGYFLWLQIFKDEYK